MKLAFANTVGKNFILGIAHMENFAVLSAVLNLSIFKNIKKF